MGVVAVLAAAAVVVLLTRDDGGTSAGGTTDWNAVAAVDYQSGEVTIVDRDGDEVQEFDTGLDSPRSFQVSPEVLVVDDGDDHLALIDLRSGEIAEFDAPDDTDAHPLPNPAGVPLLVVGRPQFANATVVAADGTSIDVAEVAGWDDPFINTHQATTDPSGTYIALTNFRDERETIVVSFEDGFEPFDVPGTVVAFEEATLTTYRIDRDGGGVLEVYDLTGERLGTTTAERLRGAVPLGDGALLTVGDDGAVGRVDVAADEVDELDRLALEGEIETTRALPGTHPAILVTAESDEGGEAFLVGADGSTTATLALGGSVRVEPTSTGAGCIAAYDASGVVIVDLATGTATAPMPVDGLVGVAASADRCTVVPFGRAVDTVLTLDGAQSLDDPAERIVAVSPDGTHVAVGTGERGEHIELRPIAALDGGEDAIELGEVVGAVHFVAT